MLVARARAVDEMLHNRRVHHGQRRHGEADHDSADGLEGDAVLAEHRVDQAVQDRHKDNDGDRVKVLHQVVGDAVPAHLQRLSHKVVGELSVHNPVDGIEGEDLARRQGSRELVDKVVVPRHRLGDAMLAQPGLFRCVHASVSDHDAHRFERVRHDASLRWSVHIHLAS